MACPDFDVTRENSAKFGVHAGDVKFDAQNKSRLNFSCPFFYTTCALKTQSNENKKKIIYMYI
jgi:hypothetical protein